MTWVFRGDWSLEILKLHHFVTIFRTLTIFRSFIFWGQIGLFRQFFGIHLISTSNSFQNHVLSVPSQEEKIALSTVTPFSRQKRSNQETKTMRLFGIKSSNNVKKVEPYGIQEPERFLSVQPQALCWPGLFSYLTTFDILLQAKLLLSFKMAFS